jgi:hypothetical protein
MDRDEFWKLIDKSRRGVDDIDIQLENLLELVDHLDIDDIFSFESHFQECVRDGYRWDIRAVAYIIGGGCSDTGFEYFLGWLVAQGRRYFEAALAEPELAAERAKPGESAECKDLFGIASSAYEAQSGKADFFKIQPPLPHPIQGTPWVDDEAYALYPELTKKFRQ